MKNRRGEEKKKKKKRKGLECFDLVWNCMDGYDLVWIVMVLGTGCYDFAWISSLS